MSAIPNVPEGIEAAREPMSEAAMDDVLFSKLSNGHTEHANGVHESGTDTDGFKMHDTIIENFRPIKVIVVGAGYSGIYHGIRIPERLRNCELVIYEKNAGVGGTWYENRYPGAACDIPSHSYQYSFNPNPNWSSMYAPGPEIRKYLQDTAEKYSVHRFVKLQHQVNSAHWNDGEGKWHVRVKNLVTGEEKEDTSDVLISARGGLNHISWPDIEGLRSFEGEIMHSAAWNENYNFEGKRIGIVGSGSSAIQIIPSLQRLPGTQLNCFIRSRTWISPPFGQATQDKLGMKGVSFSPEQIKRFNEDPEYWYKFRQQIEEDGNAVHPVTIRGTKAQLGAQAAFEAGMRERLQKKPEYFDWIKPSFAPGCRRLTPGPGFLEALVEDNVSFIRESITSIEPHGVRTSDGTLHAIDVLVCATGFVTASAPPFPVTGLNDLSLSSHWASRAETYLSLATHAFPNLFLMLGPNAAIGSGSLTMMIECVGAYIIKCIRKLQKENIKSMTVKPARVADFIAYVDAYFKGTVFTDACRSWYRKGDKITGLWPGSTLHFIEAVRSPRWEDWVYEYRADERNEGRAVNQLAWLGNGWNVNQKEERDMAWYLRPEFVEVPEAPLPEAHGGFRVRPFSY